jgi:hypothetical protein
MWGKVKLYVMKFPIVLKALSSIQAYRNDLRAYVQIGVSERSKVDTSQYGQYRLDGARKVESE